MKKVLIYVPNRRFFINYGGVGGHITHLLGVVEGFVKNNCKVTLLVSEDISRFSYPELEIDNLKTIKFRNLRLLASTLNLFRLILFKERYDFLYVRYSQSNLIFLWLLSVFVKKKLVLEVNSFGVNYRKWMRLPELIFLSRIENTLCISQQVADVAKTLMNAQSNVIVIPNGVSDRRIATRSYDFTAQLCYIGVLKHGYGLEQFFEAFAASKAYEDATKLHVFGGGPELTRLQNTYGDEKIIFHGPQNWTEIREFLIRTRPILVYPSIGSFSFQSPIKMYEYLSSGLPVIAQHSSNIEGLHDKFPFFKMADLNCSSEIDKVFVNLMQQPELAQLNAKLAIRQMKMHHSWQIRMKELLNCLRD